MKHIIDTDELEKLPTKFVKFSKTDVKECITLDDLRALLDKAPSVSGEVVANNKAILIDTDSNEFLMATMRIWNEYSTTYRDSGVD